MVSYEITLTVCLIVSYYKPSNFALWFARYYFEGIHLNVTGHNVSFSRLQVYWNPVQLDVQGYSVRYWAEKEGEESAVVRNVSKTTHSLLTERLKYFTVYVIQVTAFLTGEEITGQAKISTDESGTFLCLKNMLSKKKKRKQRATRCGRGRKSE